MAERRVFEGTLHHEDEMHSQDAYLCDATNLRLAYWQEWVKGLDGKRVRIIVEVIEETP